MKTIAKLKVRELKSELTKRNVDFAANETKAVLIEKLTEDLEKDGHDIEEVDFSQPQSFAKAPAVEKVNDTPAKTAPATRTAKAKAPPATPAKAKAPPATVPTTPSICVKSDPDRPVPVVQKLTGDEFEVTTEFDVDEFDSEDLNEDDPDALDIGFSDDLVEENSPKLFMIGIKDIRNLAIKSELEKVGSVGDVMEFQRHKVDIGTFTEEVACVKVASAETAVALVKRFNKRRLLESKNAVVLKQVINFPSKTEMKKIVKATVDDRTKQMIVEAKKRFLDLERDFAREKKSMEDAARALSAAESEISTFRKKHTMHEKNSERAKKETRRLQDELKKEREVLDSIRKSTETQRKDCKKLSDDVKTTEAELRKVENEIGKIKSRTTQLREIKKQRSRPHAYVAPVEQVSKTLYNHPISRSAPTSTRPGVGWQNDGGWIEEDVYASKYANQTNHHSGESELDQIRREREELARKSEQLRFQRDHDDYHLRQMQEEESSLEEERRQIEEMRLENERIQREVEEEKRRQALEEQKYEQERVAEERRRQLEQERQAAEQKRRELEELRNRERQKILEEKQRLEEEQRRWAEEKAAAAAARERLQSQRSSLGRKGAPAQFSRGPSGQHVAAYQEPPRRQHAGADPKARAWEETRDRMRHEREEAARKRPGIPARGYGPPSARPRNDEDVIVLDDDSPPHRGRGGERPIYSAPPAHASHGYNNPRRVPSYPPPPVAAQPRRYSPSSIPPPTVPPPTSGRSWPFNRR